MPDDGRSISRNVAHLNILVHDVRNLLYYNSYYLDFDTLRIIPVVLEKLSDVVSKEVVKTQNWQLI